MVTFDYLLQALYEIQGAADPNHGDDTLKDRMAEIYAKACDAIEQSGWKPE